MKKAILSPLCSGLIIPGLGQIINQDLKKGILLLAGVFAIFIVGIIRLVRLIRSIFASGTGDITDPHVIMARLRAEDLTLLWMMAALFILLWVYSAVDAYIGGRKIDAMEERDVTP
jgi:TM2 domain-containing membrane protein YozV